MKEFNEKFPLPLARPIPQDRLVARRMLQLADGYETSVYVHAPAGSARRLPVLYIHGIQSHPGWFAGSAAFLAGRGHAVFQPVRRGSGGNRRGRGHAASADQLLDDVGAACRFVLKQSGAARLHLLGVSWGGKLLAVYASNSPDAEHIASLTMVAPGIVPRVDVSIATKIAIGLSLFVAPRKTFKIPLSQVELFTDNESLQAYLRGDRFRLLRATSRFLYASRCLDRTLRRRPNGSLPVPTTLLLAARDRIIDNAATREIVERLTAGRAVVETFDAAHTLEFEPDPQGFYTALTAAMSRGEQAQTL